MKKSNLCYQTLNPHIQSILKLTTRIASVLIIFILVLFSSGCFSTYLTYENYSKIKNGMSYSEVVEILDNHEGELDTSAGYGGYTLSYYHWTSTSGSRCIVVGFENGRVCAKSQYGL